MAAGRGRLHQADRSVLAIADKHGIKRCSSCSTRSGSNPKLGPQRAPTPGVHNSGWLQVRAAALKDPAQHARLEAYVKGVVAAFATDRRVLAWDLWNEPDNLNGSSYNAQEPEGKQQLVLALLPKTFEWARSAKPMQPLTSGVWQGDWSTDDKMSETARVQIAQSDIVSFHNYDDAAELEKRIGWLSVSTARCSAPSTWPAATRAPSSRRCRCSRPWHRRLQLGLVVGKTRRTCRWDSWKRPYVDRSRKCGSTKCSAPTARRIARAEADLIKRLTTAGTRRKAA